jgi:hypothetical protein
LAAWSLVPILALATAGLSVESLSPDALCPPEQDTQRAVAARLGQFELDGTWHATYVLVHRTRGDFVSLKLFEPGGALKLERELPVQSGSCAALAEVIALVLESFFLRSEETAATAASVAPGNDAPTRSTTESPQEPTTQELTPTQQVALPAQPFEAAPDTDQQAASRADSGERLFLAGVELWGSTAWLAPSLRFERDWKDSYRLGASAGFDLIEHQEEAFEGTALSRRVPLAVTGSAAWSLSPLVRARGSVEALGVLEMARTRHLAEYGSGVRVIPGAGARLGAEFFPQSSSQPFIELTAAWLMRFFAPAFEVAGREVLQPPSVVLGLSLGVQTPF